ncbi:MAG: U32 family peptidase [Tissierellia bacterium]|nr:U32 family peptidase [Tissierellia bacterium]
MSPELLAPAGSMEALKAALANGADAIYLGGRKFSARAHAKNFSLEELEEALVLAHAMGKKIFVTFNILIGDEELPEALDYARSLYHLGVDALILQDLGLAQVIREALPEFELHASTQMSVNTFEGALFLEKMGFSRVVVGRETPLETMRKIKDQTQLALEAFSHGALCVSVSGQCLFSSILGGRSGNRGNCAQSCRKSYEIVNDRGEVVYPRGYLISPRDLNLIHRVDELKAAGVDSFKLEGRMKSPTYVAAITQNYRNALDGKKTRPQDMAQAFNRTTTEGLAFGAFGESYIQKAQPNHIGVEVGKLQDSDGRLAQGEITEALHEGDLLSVSGKRGPINFTLDRDLAPGKNRKFSVGERAVAGPIRRLVSKELEERMAVDEDELRGRIPLRGSFRARVGAPAVFTLADVRVESETPVERAQKRGPDPQRIRSNLEKFGDSPFFLEEVALDLDPEAFLPISLINGLRREALEQVHRSLHPERGPGRDYSFSGYDFAPGGKTLLAVEVRSQEDLEKLPMELIDRVDWYARPSQVAVDYVHERGLSIYLSLPFQPDFSLEEAKSLGYDGYRGASLGQIHQLKGERLIWGPGLNLFNRESVQLAKDRGDEVELSLELNSEQLKKLADTFGSVGEITVYGHNRNMIMKHCPLSLKKGCGSDRNCDHCGYRKGFGLKDQRGSIFPLYRYCDQTEVYNDRPTLLLKEERSLRALHPRVIRVALLEGEDGRDIIRAGRQFIQGEEISREIFNRTYTKGHYRRGIIVREE